MNPEEAFARAFIPSEKRARFVQYLANRRRRPDMLRQLDHHLPYLPQFASLVPADQDFPAELEKRLRALGAGPTCHVMARDLRIDGREVPLREALDQVCLQASGAILSCLPGRLAYYRPAPPGPGIVFQRTLA